MRVLIPRGARTAEASIDVSGCSAYRFALDVDEAVWGTRDPTSEAESDVFLTVVVYEGDREVSHDAHGFCRGARGEDGRVPRLLLSRWERWSDSETRAIVTQPGTWPKGTMAHLRLETPDNLPVGLLGAGIV